MFRKLPIEVENGIDVELFQSLALPKSTALMTYEQRLLIHSLVRYYQPRRILEIGVNRGGGSAVLLNAISDMPDAKLVSVDVLNMDYIGREAEESFPMSKQWMLYKGKDPVEIIEETGEQYDFCVIDSGHLHPIEVLNFLTVFPYLKSEAIVVIHDISMHTLETEVGTVSPNLLYTSVFAEKMHFSSSSKAFYAPNIGVLKINKATRDNIFNVFLSLNYRWFCLPPRLGHMAEYFARHYDEDCITIYSEALSNALKAEINIANHKHYQPRKEIWKTYAHNWYVSATKHSIERLADHRQLVFYGGGWMCRTTLYCLNQVSEADRFEKPCEIWDINADSINNIDGIPVIYPRFEDLRKPNEYGVVITNINLCILGEIEDKFKEIGFVNYAILEEMM